MWVRPVLRVVSSARCRHVTDLDFGKEIFVSAVSLPLRSHGRPGYCPEVVGTARDHDSGDALSTIALELMLIPHLPQALSSFKVAKLVEMHSTVEANLTASKLALAALEQQTVDRIRKPNPFF